MARGTGCFHGGDETGNHFPRRSWTVCLLVVAVVFCIIAGLNWPQPASCPLPVAVHAQTATARVAPSLDEVESSSHGGGGSRSLFSGFTKRSLPDAAREGLRDAARSHVVHPDGRHNCSHWAVTFTTVHSGGAIRQLKLLPDWCIVITAGAPLFPSDELNTIVLDDARQHTLRSAFPELLDLMPSKAAGRKNLGYLYAIMHGAEAVWDFDGSTTLTVASPTSVPTQLDRLVPAESPDCLVLNPFPAMGSPAPAWPRGFPPQLMGKACPANFSGRQTLTAAPDVAVFHSLAEGQPDVYAFHRASVPADFRFAPSEDRSVALAPGVFCPYSSKATLVTRSALWSLLLPVTVADGVGDIWRSYVAQRLLWEAGLTVAVVSPRVVTQSSSRSLSLLADVQAEEDLIYKSLALVRFLSSWRGDGATLAERAVEIMIQLYEREYVGLRDVLITAEWMNALSRLGYAFPPLLGGTTASAVPPAWPPPPLGGQQLTFWTSDLHDGTRADAVSFLTRNNHSVIAGGHKGTRGMYPEVWDHSYVRVPQRPIAPVIASHQLVTDVMTEADIRSTFEYYKSDAQMAGVDAFICMFPFSYCELWMPFNKTIIFNAAHRYSLGRCSPARWQRLTEHVQMAAARGHVIAAMGRYDAEYFFYFTGVRPTILSTTSLWYAGHGATEFTQSRPEILVGPMQRGHCGNDRGFCNMLSSMNEAAAGRFNFVPVKALYGRFTLQDIANHRAAVLIPYAVLSYGITEMYALGMPLFIPMPEFLVQLGSMIDVRMTEPLYCDSDTIPPPGSSQGAVQHPYSPEDRSAAASEYWFKFADFYTWPHITQFSSWDDLVQKLAAMDFDAVHAAMLEANRQREAELMQSWSGIVQHIASRRGTIPRSYDSALQELWGVDRLQADDGVPLVTKRGIGTNGTVTILGLVLAAACIMAFIRKRRGRGQLLVPAQVHPM